MLFISRWYHDTCLTLHLLLGRRCSDWWKRLQLVADSNDEAGGEVHPCKQHRQWMPGTIVPSSTWKERLGYWTCAGRTWVCSRSSSRRGIGCRHQSELRTVSQTVGVESEESEESKKRSMAYGAGVLVALVYTHILRQNYVQDEIRTHETSSISSISIG